MKTPVRALTAFALLLAAGCATVPPLSGPDPEREIVCYYEGGRGSLACSVALVRDGRTVFAGDPHALYRVASLTKLFLHAALLRLHAAGRLDLDAPVTATAPFPLPDEYRAVTLRDLLENRSGMPRDFLNPWSPLDWHRVFACGLLGTSLYGGFEEMDAFREGLCAARTRRCLRAREPQYSNVGFALLVLCVEHALHRRVDDVLADEVLRPLGLAETAFALTPAQRARLTPPCAGKLPWLVPRGGRVPENPLGPALRGMGSLKSSAADCARFGESLWPMLDALLAAHPPALCRDGEDLGPLRVKVLPSGRRILYRFGMIYGGASFIAFDPSTRAVFLILRNVTSWPAAEDFLLADRLFSRRDVSAGTILPAS